MSLFKRLAKFALLIACIAAFSGCATLRTGSSPGQKLDPWENWNRKVFAFNESLDENLIKPIATAYAKLMPQFARQGLDNFFANPFDAWSAVNNFLQGKGADGFEDLIRFGTNTVFGLGGLLDIAREFGLEHKYEDFGQTLGHWGVGPGAYMVLPVFGPSTVRETFALPLDRSISPALVFKSNASKTGVAILQGVNLRAGLLGASKVLEDIALDKYTFVRDAYLQRRRSLVYDGDELPVPEPAEPDSKPAPPGAKPAAADPKPAAPGAPGTAK